MADKEISLKLLIYKEKNHVVYAETDKDFVDILFSFLTMPMGTIVRFTSKQSTMSCLNILYKSLEDLDVKLFHTYACKNMLLYPKTNTECQCKNLRVKFDYPYPTSYYMCSSRTSSPCTHNLISTTSNARCHCGQLMYIRANQMYSNVVADWNDGVFIKGNMKFLIGDDLQVFPVSTLTSFVLLKELGISDATVLEEKNVNVGRSEVLALLKRSLFSKTPLTDVFLQKQDTTHGTDLDTKDMAIDSKDMAQSESDTDNKSRKISIKLLMSKSNNKVLYAEAGEEFLDLLVSFFAFPLGSVVKLLGGSTGMGCIDNLYKSVEDQIFKDCIKSEECKALLLDPKLASYFGSKNQVLQIEEKVPWQPTLFRCRDCDRTGPYITDGGPLTCSHGKKGKQLRTMNPNYPDVVNELGGAFIAGPAMFTITDELIVTPLSPISGISFINRFNFPISDYLEEKVRGGDLNAEEAEE